MASLSFSCTHDAQYPFRGMRMVERTVERIIFRCPACDGVYTALRCRSRVQTRGGRDGIGSQCRSIAAFGYVTCKTHHNDERLGLVGSDR